MTTVVATRTSLVSDSKCSEGSASFKTTKLFQVGDSLLGVAGTLTAALKFIKWFKKQDHDEPPILGETDDFDVLEVSPNGMFIWDRDLTAIEILSPFYAIGSGRMAALAALHLGTSPEQAVETACLIDSHSSGPVQVLRLPPIHLPPNPNGNPSHTKGRSSSTKARSRKPKD